MSKVKETRMMKMKISNIVIGLAIDIVQRTWSWFYKTLIECFVLKLIKLAYLLKREKTML
jgi:hypothetical protein